MISIVTITFNNFEELLATTKSLEGIIDIEHIVINGGTCSKTNKFLEEVFTGKFLSEKDNGIPDAFNKGIRLASGDAIMFLNSGDVLIDKEYIADCVKILNGKSEIDFIHSDIIFEDQLIGKTVFKPTSRGIGRGMPYYHQSMVVRQRVFDTLGLFNLNYKIAMDYDFVVRMFKYSLTKDVYINRPTVLMDGRGISSTQEAKSIAQCYDSLKSNRMLNFENYISFQVRKNLYYIRKVLIFFKMTKLLVRLKSFKRNILN